MAKRSKIVRNEQRKKMVDRHRDARKELKAKIIDSSLSVREREQASQRLRKLPRDSSATRVRNRCSLTGRPRAYYRKFGLSRIALRELALKGELPGMIKASW